MEPMALGSPPSSPASPTGNPNFLPAFLMGDPQPTTPSSPPISPGRSRTMLSSLRSTPNNPELRTLRQKLYNQSLTADTSFNQASFSSPKQEKLGPPKKGLFDTIETDQKSGTTPLSSTMHSFVDVSLTPNESFSRITNEISDYNQTISNLNESLNRSHIPVQLNLTKGDNLWVTVFGFPPSSTSIILAYFAQCGAIVDKKFPTQGNWIHLKFNSPQDVSKALTYNGRLVTKTIMVGVVPYQNKQENKENFNGGALPLVRARSLRNSYISPQNPNTVIAPQSVPQKSSGFMTKAMEYVFGW